MEIGSFIELDLRNTGERFPEENNIARLNMARAGIFHACRLLNCKKVYLPYYLCPTVKNFLLKKGVELIQYYISDNFEPKLDRQEKESAIVIVNYFGILSNQILEKISFKFKNVIIDNSAAFYSPPIRGLYSVYSPRKFFGVPDGCYLVGDGADILTKNYKQDLSSTTSAFLLKRIETGCETSYSDRMKNEERLDNADIAKMSILTKALLSNIDYTAIKDKRLRNFEFAHEVLKELNLIDPTSYIDNRNIPMVYPLVIENEDLADRLNQKKIYTGRWWNHVLHVISGNTFETWLSKYMVPMPIDQRYGEKEITYVSDILRDLI